MVTIIGIYNNNVGLAMIIPTNNQPINYNQYQQSTTICSTTI